MSLHTPLAPRRVFRMRRKAMKMNRSRPLVEFLEPRTLLSQGPRITAITPTEVINATFDHVDVTWNEPIDSTTFTTGDVSVSGPPGAVTVTGITKLDELDYRISIDPLPVRGSYQVIVGPNIADLQGNLMDQNQNGTGGETPGDQFRSALMYVTAQTVFTTNTVISETNTTYDGQDIAIKGATVTIDGPHSFDSVHLIDGAVLTHSANTATQTHKIDLTVSQQVIVDASSKIDVSGKGYLAGRTTGNTTVGGAGGGSGGDGGSYGGRGATDGGHTNLVYGDYADPEDWGSGGSNSSGGGQIHISSTTLQLDGKLIADGVQPSGVGAGSGGGIYIAVATLSGAGEIRAAGGSSGGGVSGGGGRIAVYAQDYSGFNTAKISAPSGGDSRGPDSAGTV